MLLAGRLARVLARVWCNTQPRRESPTRENSQIHPRGPLNLTLMAIFVISRQFKSRKVVLKKYHVPHISELDLICCAQFKLWKCLAKSLTTLCKLGLPIRYQSNIEASCSCCECACLGARASFLSDKRVVGSIPRQYTRT